MLLESFWFLGLIRARPGGRRVNSDSLGPGLGIVGFISVRSVRLGVAWMSSRSFGGEMPVVRFILVLSARSDAPWWSSDSFGLVGFIQVRQVGHRVHSGSFGHTLGVFGCIRVRCVHSGAA